MIIKSPRSILIATLALTLAVAPITAYPMSTMQQMFDTMGAGGNVTGPGAYQGQTQNQYTGGSFFMRVPQKNYQMMSFSPPSMSHGCGGIDVFGGAFSHINSQQFVNMLQNIGSAALSEAFFMAIDSMSPMVGVNLKQLMDKLQKATNMTINSCEAGKALARGNGEYYKKIFSDLAVDTATANGVVTDRAAGSVEIKGSDVKTAQQTRQAVAEQKLTMGNLVWNALGELNRNSVQVDNFQARLIMSMVGTMIVRPMTPAAEGSPAYQITPALRLAESGQITNLIGSADSTTLKGFYIYECFDSDASGNKGAAYTLAPAPVTAAATEFHCTHLDTAVVEASGGVNFKSMLTLVEEKMRSIHDKLRDDTIPLTQAEQDFINATSIPVYKMLAVSTAMKTSGLGEVMINSNKGLIAAEYANAYVTMAMSTLSKALTIIGSKPDSVFGTQLLALEVNMNELKKATGVELGHMHNANTTVNIAAEQVMRMEKVMMSSLPNNISGAMSLRKLQ